MENRWCAWKPPQQKQKTKQKTNLGGKKQSCVSRRKDQRDNSIKGCQMLITHAKKGLHLFLAPCRGFFSLAELCPCYPLCRGSQLFCTVTSPGGTQRKISLKTENYAWKKVPHLLSTLRLLLPAAATLDEFGEPNTKGLNATKFLRAKLLLQVAFSILGGYNVCTDTTWGSWKDARLSASTFTCGQVIVSPIWAVTHPVTQVTFVWVSDVWDSHLDTTASKIHLFIQKEDMNCG